MTFIVSQQTGFYITIKNTPFWPKTGKKDFFRKIGLRHFLSWIILGTHAKNQKIPMNQFREKL